VQVAFDSGYATSGKARLDKWKGDDMAETTAKSTKPRKTPARATAKRGNARSAATPGAGSNPDTPALTSTRTAEAKSRFNAALEEARAGAALLGAEARERVGGYSSQARSRSDDWVGDARTKAGELAVQSKNKASEALRGASRLVADNAGTVEQNLGAKYGDYVRTASQKLLETADTLDRKSVEDLGEDAREMVRKSPGAAVGLAALAGFLLARLFRR
jgi:ElaB/YqjD/DUF883 family membrane-anchored ribosome-binding protein